MNPILNEILCNLVFYMLCPRLHISGDFYAAELQL